VFETPPTIREPSKAEVEAYAERHFIGLSDEELDAMWEYAKTVVDDTAILDELEQPSPPRADYADRDPGYKPGEAEDPHNIYVTKCLVESDNTGPLSGYDVGIKDNIAVAGVEMTCGSKSMEGYVPSFDATLVKRLLDAGASITGKLNMGEFGGSGSGELSAFGPILIPDHPNHLAGGSSGGSAAAVASGEVDVAIGADQAGSIRIPGALCGVVGLKPTHGLVPYTGAAGWGHSFDHAGPMSDSVADSARVLETIAGADPFDPRQSHVETQNYTEHLDRDIDEFSIGVLKEGFGHDVSDPAVDDTVRAAVDHM
jgi:amidase